MVEQLALGKSIKSHFALRCVLMAIGTAIYGSLAVAPAQAQIAGGKVIFVAGGASSAPAAEPEGTSKFQGAATLENDPELERLLLRAQQAVEDQRYDLAAVLLQQVLDGSSGMLLLRGRLDNDSPGQISFEYFKSVRDQAEDLIAHLPAEGLHVYRLTADGDAKGLMAAEPGPQREAALAEVVRRFFMSSYGDDAAYELGCQLLDRYEFIAASRLFAKILSDHPDPSVPREQVLLRLAVANARLGDIPRARAALKQLESLPTSRVPRAVLVLVRREVLQPNQNSSLPTDQATAWLMAGGTPARDGQMPLLNETALKGDRTYLWSAQFDSPPDLTQANSPQAQAMKMRRMGVVRQTGQQPGQPQSLIERWTKNGWTPAGQVLLDNNRIYFRATLQDKGNPSTVVRCVKASTGEFIFDTLPTRTDGLNMNPNVYIQMNGMQTDMGTRPSQPDEIFGFGDRVGKSMTIIDGVLYVVQGASGESGSAEPAMLPNGMPNTTPRPNELAAYTTRGSTPNSGGKLLWNRLGDDDKSGRPVESRFVSAPLLCGNVLATPVREGGGLWLYGLDADVRNSGATMWKTFLCDEPQGGSARWSPVGIAVEGGDIYVASGCGVVFSIDGSSGTVRWGMRYERSRPPAMNQQMAWGMNPGMLGWGVKGWDEDFIAARGRQLIVAPSDAECLFALDRRTGEHLWQSPKEGAKYCLGIAGESLYVAGNNYVGRYRVDGGKLLAEYKPDSPSLGRGALTSDGIFLPVGSSIVKLNLQNLTPVAQFGVVPPDVKSGEKMPPVGNVFSNGERLIVVGPDRIAALVDAKSVEPAEPPVSSKETPKEAPKDGAKPAEDAAKPATPTTEKPAEKPPEQGAAAPQKLQIEVKVEVKDLDLKVDPK